MWAGDVNYMQVGVETNIQDNTLVHVAKTNVSGNVAPTIIGDKVTVGKSFQFSLTRTSPVVCI
jgi:carbonic anhydrase/acetyltransferase-like protein (isoleucine patch superfamily)